MEFELTEREKLARSRVCLALDVPNTEGARAYARDLNELVGMYKIGKEVFTAEGPTVVKAIQEEGGDVFLDLKYHDIPNTVRGASREATKLGVHTFNVHATGGLKMMEAAIKGVEDGMERYNIERRPKVIGVTVLTSLDEASYLETFKPLLTPELRKVDFRKYSDIDKSEEDLMKEFEEIKEKFGLQNIIGKQVLHLAQMCNEAGLDGIVCSAADLYAVKDRLPPDFMYYTPGVKGEKTKAGLDQKRVFTASRAIQDGSTVLVIGRAITDPERTGKATPEEQKKSAYGILQGMAPHIK